MSDVNRVKVMISLEELWHLREVACDLAVQDNYHNDKNNVSSDQSLEPENKTTCIHACEHVFDGCNIQTRDLCCILCGFVKPPCSPWTTATYADTQRCFVRPPHSYTPLIFFREHLRRYLNGSRQKMLPVWIRTVFRNWKPCPNMCYRVRWMLKKLHVGKPYKYVFPLLYDPRGLNCPTPMVTSRFIQEIENDYRWLQTYLPQVYAQKRKNMLSHPMVLSFLLARRGHQFSFRLPGLKSRDRSERVTEYIRDLERLFGLLPLGHGENC